MIALESPRVSRWAALAVLVAALGLVALAGRAAPEDGGVRSAPASRDPARTPDAPDYDAHVRALRARLPEGGKGFTLVVHAPFVIVGNEDPARVRDDASRIVTWAATRLRGDYFAADPDPIVDVFLLGDADAYRRLSKELFGREPSSPYGYYAPGDRALVMDISSGGGTLVHELVHAYMERNFPACPAWFNEGLASLYEQSGERDGHIVGFVNWRLRGLQQAIRDGRVPSFRALCATSRSAFYGENRGTNYGVARYLCYALQEDGLLRDFYRLFLAKQKDDPTGYRTLVEVLGEKDMGFFQESWKAFVLALRLP